MEKRQEVLQDWVGAGRRLTVSGTNAAKLRCLKTILGKVHEKKVLGYETSRGGGILDYGRHLGGCQDQNELRSGMRSIPTQKPSSWNVTVDALSVQHPSPRRNRIPKLPMRKNILTNPVTLDLYQHKRKRVPQERPIPDTAFRLRVSESVKAAKL